MSGKVWSLRRLLLTVLLGLTLALWASSAAIVYVEAQQESDELFDQSLAETAHLLLTLVEDEVQAHAHAPLQMKAHPNPRRYLLFQVRNARGQVLYRNDGAPDAALAVSQPDGFSWTTLDTQRWRVFALWNEGRRLQMVVAEPTSHREDISNRFFYKIAAFALLLVALATAAIWWCINRIFRVMQRSANEVAARTSNDLAEVDVDGAPSEVHPLLTAINRLFGRVRRDMEQQQRFTADAAHELRTPLAAIKTNLQVLKRARNDAERDEFITGLSTSVDRATRLVDQLMTLAQLDPQDTVALQAGDLADVIGEQAAFWQAACARNGLTLTLDIAPAPCAFQADSMRMLLRNLADNAVRYTPAPGAVTISCGEGDGTTFLRVSDSGPGIPAPMQERVFERFFRLAGAAVPGSGLGLSIVRRIADSHGAAVSLSTGAHGCGLVVEVRFPPLVRNRAR